MVSNTRLRKNLSLSFFFYLFFQGNFPPFLVTAVLQQVYGGIHREVEVDKLAHPGHQPSLESGLAATASLYPAVHAPINFVRLSINCSDKVLFYGRQRTTKPAILQISGQDLFLALVFTPALI